MEVSNVNGKPQYNPNVAQNEELMKKLNSQGTTQVAGDTQETKGTVPEQKMMDGPSVVITKATTDPTAPPKTEQKQTMDAPELEKALHSFREADAKFGTAVQQFMAKYNLTEKECITFLEEALAESNGTAKEKPVTQAAVTKMVAVSSSGAYQKIMFDLYALLALMQETAQKERNAARLIRYQQNEQIQNAIKDQADLQRYAAKLGFVFGLISVGISVIQFCHNAFQTYRGTRQETNLREQYGVGKANQEFKAASQEAKTVLESKDNLTAAQLKMENTLSTKQSTDLKSDCDSGLASKEALLEKIDNEAGYTSEQKAAAKEYTNAFFENKEKLDQGGLTSLNRYKAAQTDLATKMEAMKADAGYTQAMSRQDHQGIRNLNYGMLVKLTDALGQAYAGYKNAEATRDGAAIKKAEEELDQIKDLFKQQEEVIQTVLNTIKAIQQAESQTIQGMFRA